MYFPNSGHRDPVERLGWNRHVFGIAANGSIAHGVGMARRVVLVAFPDLQLLDLAGPLEVFSMANRFGKDRGADYALQVATSTGSAIRATSGIEIAADRAVASCRGPIDTLIVAG